MKKYFCLSAILFLAITTFSQTQQGFVKTKGRMDAKGNLIPGQGLKGATVSIQGRTAVLVNRDDGAFSFPVTEKQFRLDSVRKKGYQLVDMDACPRAYKYSGNPLYIVMETPEQQLQDQLTAERKIRRNLQRQLQKREDELEELKEQQKISDEEYRAALKKLYDDTDSNEKLVKDMVERYSRIDYDQLSEIDQRISEYILNGELTKADSLLRTKGDIGERLAQLQHLERANASEEQELVQRQQQLEHSKTLAAKERNDLANDCYRKYEIFKLRYENDSAAYFIELRASLDTTRLQWQREAGLFVDEYLAQYEKAKKYFFSMLRQAEAYYGPDNDTVAIACDCLGVVCFEQQQLDEAIAYFNRALDIVKDNPVWANYAATLYSNIGIIHSVRGENEANLEYQQRSLAIREKIFAPDDFEIGNALFNIASAYENMGNYTEAEQQFRATLSIWEKVYQENHPMIASAYSELSLISSKMGDFAKALEYGSKALKIRKTLFGDVHPDLGLAYNNLGSIYSRMGNSDKALECYQQAMEIWEKTIGSAHYHVASVYNNMGNVYIDKGDLAQAEQCHRKSIEIRGRTLGLEHPDLASSYNGLGMICYYQGKVEQALEYFGKSLSIMENALGPEHPNVALAYHNIGYIYCSQGKYDLALEYLRHSLGINKKVYETDNQVIASNYNIIGHCLFGQEKYGEALEYYNKALKIRHEILGDEHPETIDARERVAKTQGEIEKNKK